MPLSRLKQLHQYMEEHQLDAILVTSPKHVYYLSGFLTEPHERFLGLVIPAAGEPSLLVPALEQEAAAAASTISAIHTHRDTDDPYRKLKQVLPARIKRLGIEKNHLSVAQFEQLAEVVQAEQYLDVAAPLRQMRLIKSADEIERIKRAVHLVEQVLQEGLKRVAIGVTEQEIAAELDYQMKKLGATGPAFATTVLAGEKSALPHGQSGSRPIAAGELLLFDLGVYVDGYSSDITRTFVVGEASAQQKEMYEAVLAGNLAAIAAVKPGATLASIDRAARQEISQRGYGQHFIHRVGHGLGIDVHEYPSVHGENQELLQPGMVFTIEPGVYLPGIGGVRIEDDVGVTEQGVEVLTRFSKELTVIGEQ